MEKKFIKLGSLLTISAAMLFGPVSNVNAANEYKLNNDVKVYMNADNAKSGSNARGTYSAGKYFIYKTYNGMINITRVEGKPGAWINPKNNISTSTNSSSSTSTSSLKKETSQSSTGDYTLNTTVKGYMNAANAKSGNSAVTTLSVGKYYIYREYNGMLNLTKVKGQPGAWVNPNSNNVKTETKVETKPQTKVETKTETKVENKTQTNSNTFTLKNDVNGYMNAALAKSNSGSNVVVKSGTYHIYKTYDGMINVTSKAGSPGSWINPNATKVVTNSSSSNNSSTSTTTNNTSSTKLYSLSQFQYNGVINWSGYKFTYYSQSVLPGYGLRIPGRHLNADGYVSDGDGYIVLAANSNIAKGTVISTPFGYKGKVYDTCPSCTLNWYDVYTK